MFIFPVAIQQILFRQEDKDDQQEQKEQQQQEQQQNDEVQQPQKEQKNNETVGKKYTFNKYSSLKEFTDDLDSHDIRLIREAGYICNNTIIMTAIQNYNKHQYPYHNYTHFQDYIQICQKINTRVRQSIEQEQQISLDYDLIRQEIDDESNFYDQQQSHTKK